MVSQTAEMTRMFLNLVMLAGLGGAVIPLVLHLLARSRYRTVDWGAMMFIEGLDARQAQRARLKQWILLATRMLLVSLVAVALARPIVRGRFGGLEPEGRVTAVIVLDRSYSLAFEEAGRSRFDKAREAVLQILGGLRKGDEVALVLLGEQVDVREPTSNLQMVGRQVTDLQVSSGSADLSIGLARAREILDQSTRLNRELYIVTDRQAVSWRNVDQGGATARWASDSRLPVRFYVVSVGGEDAENVDVESVELVEGTAVRQQPAEVEVRVRNYGSSPRAGMELSLYVTGPSDAARKSGEPGRRIKTLPVTVAAHGAAALRIPVVFNETGSHVLTAAIKAPGLEMDNRFDTAIDVIDPIQTLIVSGDERVEELRHESFFLRLALSPYQSSGKRPGDSAVVTVKTAEEFSSVDLTKYQVIILANVPQLSADQARALEQRVYEGGGLIVCPGNLCRVDNYNSLLYRDGLGLLPAKLDAATPADGSYATTLLGLELSHPIFRFRRGADPLPSAAIGRYFPATPRVGDAFVLGTLGSGEPFLIEGPRGRGRVLLLTTPLDADWNTLPLHPFYLPFVQSMVRYVNAPAGLPRNLQPGELLSATFNEVIEEAAVNEQRLDLPASGARKSITYADTLQPGVYRFRVKLKGSPDRWQTIHYVVQGARIESDLTPLTQEQWARLSKALGFVRLEGGNEVLRSVVTSDRRGHELWLAALLAAMGLGIGEMWLARRWSRGVT
jgi:hypothetical protein